MKRVMLLWLLMTLPSLAAERVVSIGGDVTQIIYALDAQSQLVARDSTSLRPAQAARLPDVGYMRQLNAEGILALKPTLVIASAQAQPSLVLQQIARAASGWSRSAATAACRQFRRKLSLWARRCSVKAKLRHWRSK